MNLLDIFLGKTKPPAPRKRKQPRKRIVRVAHTDIGIYNSKYKNGAKLKILDQQYSITIIPTPGANLKVFISAPDILVKGDKKHLSDKTTLVPHIRKSIKQKFKLEIRKLVGKYADLLGAPYNSLRLKDNITNWGSCSSKRNININWRLIFAPREVLEYVVIHEVCHLKEMNHSKRFWDLVERYDPTYKKKMQWLKTHGKVLFDY